MLIKRPGNFVTCQLTAFQLITRHMERCPPKSIAIVYPYSHTNSQQPYAQ